jgi:hypothetical protein
VLGPVSCKAMMRANPLLNVGQGNHQIFQRNGKPVRHWASHPALTLREYPTRSLPQFRRKAIQGGEAIEAAKSLESVFTTGQHWTTRFKAWQTEGDAGLLRLLQRAIQRDQQVPGWIDPLPLNTVIDQLKARLPADQQDRLADDCLRHTLSP